MNGAPFLLADLLAECDVHGIQLAMADGGGLEIDAPQDTLEHDLLARLKAHKGELLAMLEPTHEVPPIPTVAAGDAPAEPKKAVCRCGSTTWRDVPIHGGESVRRDCGRCGRFLSFSIWYNKNTLRIAQ